MNDLNHIYKVGNLIRYLREEKKLSQSQLGEKIGVSNKTISKWENGRGYPDTLILLSLTKELEITVDELLKGELNKNNKVNNDHNKINNMINYKAELTLFKRFLLSLVPTIILIIYLFLLFFCGLDNLLNSIIEFIIGKPLGNHMDMILFIIIPMWITVLLNAIIATIYVFKIKNFQTTKFMKILTSIVIFFAFSIQYFAVLIYMIIRLLIAKNKNKK